MKLTNDLNLPKAIYNAIANDPYTKGKADISVTGLIAPARQRALIMKHNDELTEDAADRIWSLIGQIGHGILERADDPDVIREERLFIQRQGWTISGKFDRLVLEDGRVGDFKFSSVWAIKDGVKPEWTAQVNLYALFLRQHGYRVESGEIIVILRDWSKGKARREADKGYPPHQVAILPVEMWADEQCETYIEGRLKEHEQALFDPPLCTPEERWERGGRYSVWKPGNKRATSWHDTEAQAFAASKPGHEIRREPMISIRCTDYCPAAPVCSQWASIRQEAGDAVD